jgi:transcriptional regulator with XRE-family HTH domain
MSVLADRIAERMAHLGMSQAALARALGVSQQAVGKLVGGKTRSTSYIADFARELRTTVAYLTGEIDDPDEGAPPPLPKPTAQVVTMQVLLPDTRALQRMFLGVLKASEGLSQEALAHELALLLPKGLALLQGPLVFAETADAGDPPAAVEAERGDRPARRRA